MCSNVDLSLNNNKKFIDENLNVWQIADKKKKKIYHLVSEGEGVVYLINLRAYVISLSYMCVILSDRNHYHGNFNVPQKIVSPSSLVINGISEEEGTKKSDNCRSHHARFLIGGCRFSTHPATTNSMRENQFSDVLFLREAYWVRELKVCQMSISYSCANKYLLQYSQETPICQLFAQNNQTSTTENNWPSLFGFALLIYARKIIETNAPNCDRAQSSQ